MSKICTHCKQIYSSIVKDKIGRIKLTEQELQHDPIEHTEFGEQDFICPICISKINFKESVENLNNAIYNELENKEFLKFDVILIYDTFIKIRYYANTNTIIEKIINI